MNMSKKILSIVIILLFVVVSYSTAISVDSKSTKVESVEDCGCIEIEDKQLVVLEKNLNRLEVYSKLLLVLSNHYPKLKEIDIELSNWISILVEINEKLKLDYSFNNNPIICAFLAVFTIGLINIWKIFMNISDLFPDDSVLYNIFYIIAISFGNLSIFIVEIGNNIGCWELPPPPPY